MNRAVIITLFLCALPRFAIHAQEPATDGWNCARCVYPAGWSLETEVGGGYVSDSSFKFGDYTGLNEAGGFFVGDILADYWGESETHWHFEGLNLGLDSRSVAVDGGRQGQYELRFSYDKLPQYLFDSGDTPFINPVASSLMLPGDWVPGATTADMPTLNQSLRSVDIRTDRETVGLGFSFVQNERLEYDVNYQYSTKEGTGIYGGSFLNTATILSPPVYYQTQILEAGLTYQGASGSARFGYFGSIFSNEKPTLRWNNPFTPVVSGAAEGQAAMEPDNEFHQLMLSGQYQPMVHTQLSGSLAVGRMLQDDDLLPFTINPDLASTLPARSLDAEVQTLHVDLRIASRPIRKLRLRGAYTFDERDNETHSLDWSYVTTDALAAASRANLPYGYERHKIDLAADYQLPLGIKAYGGWNRNVDKRDFAEVNRSEEDELWGKLKFRIGNRADLAVKYAYADRDIFDYQLVPATQPPQNPLLRKYNLAGREREGLELNLALRPTDNLNFSLVAEFMDDDYDESALGLVDADYESVYGDAGFLLPGNASLTVHGGYEYYESKQWGSQSFSLPDWQATNTDETVFAGVVMTLPRWLDRIDMHLAYTFTETTGKIQTDTSGLRDAFPDLKTTLHRAEFNVDYQMREDLQLRLGWIFEDYSVDDWSLDGVNVDTLPRVLSLGNQWLGYDVNVIMVSFQYSLNRSE